MKKADIAIMTWYTYRNFGTALQATALYSVIEEMGYSPRLINYQPKGNTEPAGISRYARKAFVKIRNCSKRYREFTSQRSVIFSKFLDQRIKTTAPCCSIPELQDLNETYDAFVCGSDQIWSSLCYDDKYFLSFVRSKEKMVAYAPSMASVEISDPVLREEILANISRFRYLSVRERQTAQFIRNQTGQEVDVVLDPTMLLSTNQWESLVDTADVPKIEGDYILCYFLGNEKRTRRKVHRA